MSQERDLAEVIRLREALATIKFLAEERRARDEMTVELCRQALDNKFVESFRLSL